MIDFIYKWLERRYYKRIVKLGTKRHNEMIKSGRIDIKTPKEAVKASEEFFRNL